jgi:hypothetical protein
MEMVFIYKQLLVSLFNNPVADLGGGGARGGRPYPKFFLGGRRPPKNFEKKAKTH